MSIFVSLKIMPNGEKIKINVDKIINIKDAPFEFDGVIYGGFVEKNNIPFSIVICKDFSVFVTQSKSEIQMMINGLSEENIETVKQNVEKLKSFVRK